MNIEAKSCNLQELEVEVWQALDFQLWLNTPEDYLEDFLELFPYHIKMFRTSLPKFIELGMIHPRACQLAAKDIFFGSVLAAIKTSGVLLSDKKKQMLLAVTDCWQKAKDAGDLIESHIH